MSDTNTELAPLSCVAPIPSRIFPKWVTILGLVTSNTESESSSLDVTYALLLKTNTELAPSKLVPPLSLMLPSWLSIAGFETSMVVRYPSPSSPTT